MYTHQRNDTNPTNQIDLRIEATRNGTNRTPIELNQPAGAASELGRVDGDGPRARQEGGAFGRHLFWRSREGEAYAPFFFLVLLLVRFDTVVTLCPKLQL